MKNNAIEGKLLDKYILLITFIFLINLVFNLIYQQLSHVYVYAILAISQIGVFFLKDSIKNNRFIRFWILVIVSFSVFYMDSYYTPSAMIFMSYLSITATFPILFDLKKIENI